MTTVRRGNLAAGTVVALAGVTGALFVSPAAGVALAVAGAAALAGYGVASLCERRPRGRDGDTSEVDVRPDEPVERADEEERPQPRTPLSGQVPEEPAATEPVPDLTDAEKPVFRFPHRLDCGAVVQALLQNARDTGPCGGAHLWLEDPATGTLRLVAAAGPLAPSREPVPVGEGILGQAVSTDTAVLAPVSRIVQADGEATLWRYAVPVTASEARGVAAVDFMQEPSDPDALNGIAVALRGPLAGCLALHIARQERQAAEILLQMARELSRLLLPEEVVQTCLSKAVALSDAATGSVMLLDEQDGDLTIAAARGLPRDVVADTRISEGEGIAGWVLASRQPLLVEDLQGSGKRARRHGVRSAISVPIADEDGILGVLNVGSRTFPARFTSSHMQALEVLARQTAAALRNARAVASSRELYFATLKALALALETKDPYASGATERVVHYAAAIGKRMSLEESEQHALEIAALLHDIGMTAAGDSLAVGDRPLSTVERGILKMHPVLAAEILEQAPALRSVIPMVYHHHEWYDGRGYVGGLAGEAIPLGARILALADAYVAMTSDRPYRSALSERDALREVNDMTGTQFDPEVVTAFRDVLRDEQDRRRAEGLRS